MTIDVTEHTVRGEGFTIDKSILENAVSAVISEMNAEYPDGRIQLHDLMGLCAWATGHELGFDHEKIRASVVGNPDFNYVVAVMTESIILGTKGSVPSELRGLRNLYLRGVNLGDGS